MRTGTEMWREHHIVPNIVCIGARMGNTTTTMTTTISRHQKLTVKATRRANWRVAMASIIQRRVVETVPLVCLGAGVECKDDGED